MSKHTPGPWLIAESVVSRHAVTNMRRIRSKNEGLEHGAVCDVYGIQDGSEASANARLIAAAPDLLAACEFALAHAFERKWDEDGRAFTMISSALRKATGGAA